MLGEEEEEEEEEKKKHSLFPLSPLSVSSLTSTAASFPSHSAGCSIDIGGDNLCSSLVSGGLAGDGVAVAGISFRSFPGGGEEAPEGDRSEGGERVVGWGEGGETERGVGGGRMRSHRTAEGNYKMVAAQVDRDAGDLHSAGTPSFKRSKGQTNKIPGIFLSPPHGKHEEERKREQECERERDQTRERAQESKRAKEQDREQERLRETERWEDEERKQVREPEQEETRERNQETNQEMQRERMRENKRPDGRETARDKRCIDERGQARVNEPEQARKREMNRSRESEQACGRGSERADKKQDNTKRQANVRVPEEERDLERVHPQDAERVMRERETCKGAIEKMREYNGEIEMASAKDRDGKEGIGDREIKDGEMLDEILKKMEDATMR